MVGFCKERDADYFSAEESASLKICKLAQHKYYVGSFLRKKICLLERVMNINLSTLLIQCQWCKRSVSFRCNVLTRRKTMIFLISKGLRIFWAKKDLLRAQYNSLNYILCFLVRTSSIIYQFYTIESHHIANKDKSISVIAHYTYVLAQC